MLPETLLAACPAAPPSLRERVRLIAAAEPATRRRLPRRRLALALALAVAAAAVASGLAVGLSGRRSPAVSHPPAAVWSSGAVARVPLSPAPAVLPPSPGRAQDYSARLELRVPTAAAVSDRTKRALAITRRLGGVVTRVDLSSHGRSGAAEIVMRIPVGRVQDAVVALGALGRIVGQHVVITDAERRIEALEKQVQESSGKAKETAQALLGRELRKARLARIAVGLSTPPAPVPAPPKPEPTAMRILRAEGRYALDALLVAGPIVLIGLAAWLVARTLRRRSERRLLGA